MDIDVILPAGGRIRGEFAGEAGTEVKALIQLGGQSVLERTVAALRATGRIRRIVAVGPDSVRETALSFAAGARMDAALPEGDTGPENIFRALDWLRANAAAGAGSFDSRRVLIVTTDLPFLTPEALSGFLRACPPDGDICLPVISREAFQTRFPASLNTYVPLRDGHWTVGCVFLVNAGALERSRGPLENIFAARKSQLRMARLLGPIFVLRFLLRRLSVLDIERRCGRILGCAGAAVRDCAPELAFDIDLPGDYRYAVEWLEDTQGASR